MTRCNDDEYTLSMFKSNHFIFLDKSIEPIILKLLVNIIRYIFFFITLFSLGRSTILCTIIIHLISIIMPIILFPSLPDVRHSEAVTTHWSWIETWPIIQKAFPSMSDWAIFKPYLIQNNPIQIIQGYVINPRGETSALFVNKHSTCFYLASSR